MAAGSRLDWDVLPCAVIRLSKISEWANSQSGGNGLNLPLWGPPTHLKYFSND